MLIFLFFCALVFFAYICVRRVHTYVTTSPGIIALEEKWRNYDYEAVHQMSHGMLQQNPYDNVALVYHGYSSFFLSVSRIDTEESKAYLDEAINSLRIALYKVSKEELPQVEYMLGKAYFYKNTITSYYYSDLALKYLKASVEGGYKAIDTAEYMGLCYAQLGDHMDAIASFTESLLTRESPSLLLSIADEYYKAGQANVSKQYLFRIKKEAVDDELILKSMNLLASIYLDEKSYGEAKNEFEEILEKYPNSPDACYGLGVVYEKLGDIVKARAQWRRTLKMKPNHVGALDKLSIK